MRGFAAEEGRPPPEARHEVKLARARGSSTARTILISRGLRAFADGYVAVLLPAYLLALGLNRLDVGLLGTATLAGSALATLAVGAAGHRWSQRHLLLLFAAALMAATGVGFVGLSSFWPLAVVAFVGTLNPSSGDVSLFLPLEQARLATAAAASARTSLYARHTVSGSLCASLGALNTAAIERVLGKGTYNKAGNIFKITRPLDDIKAQFGANISPILRPPARAA